MNLLPGCRLVVAPHFHLGADWSRRVSLGAGVQQSAEGLLPIAPWHQVGDDELALLLIDPAKPTACQELLGCLCLFGVPDHLRSAFWNLLAQATGPGEIPAIGYSAFVAEIARFLAFKQLPAPAGAAFDLVVNQPGQRTALAVSSLWGLINLGEDSASVVFVNILESEIPGPDYPPVRLHLPPGEGVRLPAGVLFASDTTEPEHTDVLLLIRLPGEGFSSTQ